MKAARKAFRVNGALKPGGATGRLPPGGAGQGEPRAF